MAMPYTKTVTKTDLGSYFAKVEEIPECIAEGETPEDALEFLDVSLEMYLKDAIANDRDVPVPAKAEKEKTNVFSSMLLINHEIKVYIAEGKDGDNVKRLTALLKIKNICYAIGDCLLAQEKEREIGCQILFYLDDGEENDDFVRACVDMLSECGVAFSLFVDKKEI